MHYLKMHFFKESLDLTSLLNYNFFLDFKGELRVRFLNNVICLTFELIFCIYNFTLSTERKTQLIRKQILFTIVTSYFISDKMIHWKFYYYST